MDDAEDVMDAMIEAIHMTDAETVEKLAKQHPDVLHEVRRHALHKISDFLIHQIGLLISSLNCSSRRATG